MSGDAPAATPETQLDPDAIRVVEHVASWDPPGGRSVEVVRQAEARRHRELDAVPEPVDHIDWVGIPSGAGTVPATVYVPHGGRPDGVVVHLHGGGWTVGSAELWDPQMRMLANAGNCTVVAVDFRLAPEHPFPAGLDDAYAAAAWATSPSSGLGGAADAVVIGGDSSGGNMAAAVALMARDRRGPRLAGQLLVYPATARDADTTSRRVFDDGHLLSVDALLWFWNQYLGLDGDAGHPYASPLLAEDLTGLPPAIVATAGCDILRDEGELYAGRLADAAVPVRARRFDGMLHGFLGQARLVRGARSAFDWIGESLGQLFAEFRRGARSVDAGGGIWTPR